MKNGLKKQISYLKRKGKIEVSKRFEKQLYAIERKRIQNILKKNNKLILIYTLGKVGSSSVYESLKQNEQLNIPVFHLHSLTATRINDQKKYYKSSARKSIPFHLIQSTVLHELLESYSGQIYVFSLIREPIQRELSSIFQDSFNFTSSKNLAESGIKEVINQKIEKLTQNLPEKDWFDNELKPVFDFDMFSEYFDVNQGYTILNNKKAGLAFIRLENLNENFDQICKQLFNTDINFNLSSANLGDEKFYDNDYKGIKKQLKFSKDKLDKILNSEFVQKFYSDYIPTIRKRWQKEN